MPRAQTIGCGSTHYLHRRLPSSFTLDDVALLLAAGVAYLIARWLLTGLGTRLLTRASPRLGEAL